jgi:hypothetical protein
MLHLSIDAFAFRSQSLDCRFNLPQSFSLSPPLLLASCDHIGNRALLVLYSRKQLDEMAHPRRVAELRSLQEIDHLLLQRAFSERLDDAIDTKQLAIGENGHGRGSIVGGLMEHK